MHQIKDFFVNFFNTDNFPPRWYCGKWSEFHGWLYIISDLAIFAAYFTIPFLLIHFIRRKKDVPFPRIFWLFGAFILACGTTHLIDAIIFWVPIYRVSAFVRMLTAFASWSTIYVLYKVLPDAFSLKTPAELEREVNERTDELHLALKNMRFLADAMPQIVWTAKADGTRDYFNEPSLKYSGRTLEQMLGWNWLEIVHPDDVESCRAKWEQSLNNGTEFEMELRFRAADGNYHWFLSRALPQHDANGNIVMWVGTGTEIESQKRTAEMLENKVAERTEQLRIANAELTQSNDDLENFASVASHDLQAPLRTINMYLDMLLSKNEDLDEQSVKYMGRITEATLRMKSLIQNLLEFSKVHAVAAEFEPIDLNETLGSVSENIAGLIEKHHAKLVFDELPTVNADRVQMEQLLQNLISNGIIYNESDNPEVTIDYTEDSDYYTIRVSDNGTGIEEKNLNAIFDVFTRLRSDKKGTGLGLSISRRIVDKHAGKIWVESEVGKGTSFYFTLSKALKNN